MKKFLKTFFALASLAAVAGGAYYLLKKYVLDDDLSDFDLYGDFDDLAEFEDDFDEEPGFDSESGSGKEYVTLDLNSEGAIPEDFTESELGTAATDEAEAADEAEASDSSQDATEPAAAD